MPPSSSRTHFRQRPYRKRRPRAVGSDLKGCVLCLLPVHPSDLVHSSCEGASKTSRGDCEKWEREEDPTILLLLGRDDLVLSACLRRSAQCVTAVCLELRSALSRLCYSARRAGYTFTRSPDAADLSMAAMTSWRRTASAKSGTVCVPFSMSAANAA